MNSLDSKSYINNKDYSNVSFFMYEPYAFGNSLRLIFVLLIKSELYDHVYSTFANLFITNNMLPLK